MFDIQDENRNSYMLKGTLARKGYDWWWHSFTGIHHETGEEKAFFIEYFLCNPKLGGASPVYGQLPENKVRGIRPSYLMVKAGCWGKHPMQLHRFYGWDEIAVKKSGAFEIEAEECYASDELLIGSVSITDSLAKEHPEWMCDSGSMSWNLNVQKEIAYHVGFGASKPFRLAEAFEMYWHAEGMKTQFYGTVTVNGEIYDVVPGKCHGYSDKNWGRNFTSPWVWLSSNCLKSRITGKVLENSAFDIGGGKPKVYMLELDRKLLGGFYYEGEEFDYNFSKIWTLPRTKFHCWETDTHICWHVRQENADSVMDTKVKCKKSEMLLVNYEAPDGKKRHNRLWNGGTGVGLIHLYRKKGRKLELIDEIEATHIGCEYGEYTE